MNSVTQFVNFAVVNAVGPVACEGSQSTRVEFTSPEKAELRVVLEVAPHGDGLAATISGNHGDGEVQTETVHGSRGAFEDFAYRVASRLPDSLGACNLVEARFTGVQTDGTPMVAAGGNSMHGAILRDTATSAALASTGSIPADASIQGILTAGVNTAVDHIDSREGNYARIRVDDGKGINGLWWVLVSRFEGKITAQTNDMDFLAPVGPSFYFGSDKADEVKAQILAFLTEKYKDATQVSVRVFREESVTGEKPILEGTSESGGLVNQPEYPSL